MLLAGNKVYFEKSLILLNGSDEEEDVERREVILHGHRVSYTEAGAADGPLLVLVHGVAGNSHTWDDAIFTLQRSVHVIAPDPVSYTHLRAHETRHDLVCRLLLEKKKSNTST